ncbi:SepM family pheromone-processing serine protease [Levilactobacillus namurensis]|uniref:SepM family pheromone-processing serine protease n=1 Tax=Levilactobacillus namurensis TaxID=380393 RepID=UPI002230F32D|nr:SepM family pheromone-processing serine protease [Levilactobacillus namurensis]MCW3778069.1 PDZ domain-containing protein [Levilactobacillus namurensis]MDT7018416.1 SepM family pheromone-processing serine protease [Levilactobacillus namurensis]WNN64598.1 SepM family pheromone-processing serine protease [Levilactobacillus namurensis]
MKRLRQLSRRQWWQILGTALAVVAILAFFLFPLPRYIEGPGEADDLKTFVKMPGHADKRSGKFMITSVALAQARPVSYLYAKFNPYYTIEPVEAVTGGESNATYDKVQNFYMQSAINEAIYTAYHAAKRPVKRQYLGIYVLSVDANSPFKRQLKVGDTVTKVNGHHFDQMIGYQRYIQRQPVGAKATITFKHNQQTKTATAKLMRLPTKKAGIGITLTDNVKVTPKTKVTVDPGNIGGPSGGLMFSLQIYQQLTGENLRQGRKIAGTGTVDSDGNVGEIGGIDKKIIAVKRAGATVFFAPYIKPNKLILKYEENHQTNYQLAKATAKRYAPKMKVVPVTSFKDAVQYLKTHPNK